MEIWEEMGRDSTDRLVLESMYGYGSGMDFYMAAKLLLQADTALYDGKNFCTLYPILLNRGLIEDSILPDPCSNFDPSIPIFAGRDTTICFGASVLLGGSPTTVNGNTVSWSPDFGLNDPTSFNPVASPPDSTLYTVTVTDTAGFFNTDAIRVFVKTCSDEPILGNTANFAQGIGLLNVILPVGQEDAEVWVSDAMGRLLFRGRFNDLNRFDLPVQPSAAGVYLVRVKVDGEKAHTLKAVRFTD
jgi:hypothetical protein